MTNLPTAHKWHWMVDYCQQKGWAPADPDNWLLAGAAWEQAHSMDTTECTLSARKALEIIKDRATARKQQTEQTAQEAKARAEQQLAQQRAKWKPVIDILEAFRAEYPNKLTLRLQPSHGPIGFVLHLSDRSRGYNFFELKNGFQIQASGDASRPFGPHGKAATVAEFIPPLLDLLSDIL